MKGMKRLWARRPRLSRGWKTVRNLAVSLACLCVLWVWAGYPMPTAELEFRKLEGTYLVGPSDIQGMFQGGGDEYVVGTWRDQVVLGYGSMLYFCSRQEGPALVPAVLYRSIPEEIRFVAVDVPPGTASARLEAAVSCWWSGGHGSGYHISAEENGKPWSRSYQAQGELLEEGGVLFRVTAREDKDTDDGFIERSLFNDLSGWYTYRLSAAVRSGNARLEAVFYDESGGELGRAALCTPEQG